MSRGSFKSTESAQNTKYQAVFDQVVKSASTPVKIVSPKEDAWAKHVNQIDWEDEANKSDKIT